MRSNGRGSVRNHTFQASASRQYGSRTSSIARVLLVLLFFSMLLPAPRAIVQNRVLADSTDLVPSFGTGGIVMTDLAGGNDSANAVAATRFGKIIAAGSATIPGRGTDFALACYDSNGNLDANFGDGGKVTTDFFGANDGARGVAIQLDGKIVVSGFATNDAERQFSVVRYLVDGTLDPTFDQDGKLALDLGSTSEAFKLAVQEDDKIVAVGDSRPQNSLEFTIVRLNQDGSRDSTFGNNGVVTVDFGNADRAIDLAIDGENIFVCGFAVKSATDSNLGIARLNLSNGSLNNAFDGDGKLEVDFFGKRDAAQSIILRAPSSPVNEPHLIVGGFSTPLTSDLSDFALVAVDYQGSSINSLFNPATVDFAGGTDQVFRVFGQPDGDIVAAGWAGSGQNFDLGMTKWKADGSLDLDFGPQGKLTLDTASGGNNVAFDGIIYLNNIITAGVGLNPITGNDDFVVTLHENEKFAEFTKTVSPNPVVRGDIVTYTFTFKNLTINDQDFRVSDVLPVGLDPQLPDPNWSILPLPGEDLLTSKTITLRGGETREITLRVKATLEGVVKNKASLSSLYEHVDHTESTLMGEAEVPLDVKRPEITGATRNGKHLNVTVNSTGASQSSIIALNGIEPQAACPVVLYDGVEQKTNLDPDNPTTVLIVKKGYKKLAPGQTVRIRVRLCSGVETDDFIYTRPQ
ncbi:MAG TPA: hypothetical protein VI837_03655 [Blastocatellia bacterium]|nr:hypothetical protein [Blastocatellia bacterium]